MPARRGPQAAKRSARVLLAAIVFAISLAGSGVATMIWLHARPAQVVVAPSPSPTMVTNPSPPQLTQPGGTVTSGDVAELRGRIGQLEHQWGQARPGERLDTLEQKVDRLPTDNGSATMVLLGLFGLWLLLAIALGVIAAMLFRRFDAVEALVDGADVMASPSPPPTSGPDPAIARLERRIAQLEAAVPQAPPAPPLAAELVAAEAAPAIDPPASLDDLADELRQLINARGELETFNAAVLAHPRALAIVGDDLVAFDPAAAMDQSLVLFGSDERLAVLPAPLRARDLQRTPNARGALPESFAHFFTLEAGDGFRVAAPAYASHARGDLRLLARGTLAVA